VLPIPLLVFLFFLRHDVVKEHIAAGIGGTGVFPQSLHLIERFVEILFCAIYTAAYLPCEGVSMIVDFDWEERVVIASKNVGQATTAK